MPKPQMMAGSVVLRLSDSSIQWMRGFVAHPKVTISRDILLAFAPTEQVYAERYAALVYEQIPVHLAIGSVLSDNMAQVAFIREVCDHSEIVPVEKHLVVSLIEGVDPKTCLGVLLGVGDDLSDYPTAYLECQVVFVPSAWAAEITARKAATSGDANDDSFVDGAKPEVSPVQVADARPASYADMKAEQKRIVASYGPATVAPLSQTIGARKRYRVLAEEVPFSLAGWKCTDKQDDPKAPEGFVYGPQFRGPWKVKRTDANAITKKPTFAVDRTKDGIRGRVGERTIALEITVGTEWVGRYFKADGTMTFKAVHLQFLDQMPSKEEYWKGSNSRGYDRRYQSVTQGAVKMNLMGSKKGDLGGVYDIEVKAKVTEFRHATDKSASRSVVTYMINAYRLPPGTKPTQRLYLESAGREVPEDARVIKSTGQCLMVLVDLSKPQIMPPAEPNPVAAQQ